MFDQVVWHSDEYLNCQNCSNNFHCGSYFTPHRLRLPATVPRTRCPVTRFRITLQDNSMFDKSNPGWQPLQRDRVWKDRGGGGEKTQKLPGMSLSLDLFKYESAGHSGTLRSGETRPTISTRANKSRRFKCWHLLDSKGDQISKITIQLTTKTFQTQQVQLSQLERRASSSDPNYPRGVWAGPQGLSRGRGLTRTAESNNRAWTAGWCRGGLVEEGWLDEDKMIRIQFLGVWISCDPYCWFGTNRCCIIYQLHFPSWLFP